MEKRNELTMKLVDIFIQGHRLMDEYESIRRTFSDMVLYPVESHIIMEIGRQPGTTVTELSEKTKKTPSACSQQIRKLREKGLVFQTRNEVNNRIYHLYLTEKGQEVFESHEQYEKMCHEREMNHLKDFSAEELETYMRVQANLNLAIEESNQANDSQSDAKCP